ncbi:regulatory protein, gntR family [Micromonospora pattaloongensis]|uniref:Regulatory protein, gntR family n=1 Tax=Micromonospora pattaloongensis TaxID=405436 RepID=A0A1H3LXD5_9ACTN|nr:winged helix-turn-helix domain-containing protein [Micromonospora pattaloongensis]SDY69092.1 regulatory protein, gntR family [Micromonospora pattaloongensis]
MPAIPLSYTGIAADIATRINAGEYKPGTKLPSYTKLAELYSVSFSTAARAVALLRDRGVVIGSPGRGVFVADRAERSETTRARARSFPTVR